MKVFIGGEGADDIGDWAGDPAYRPTVPNGGVVEALLRCVRADGWAVASGCPWKKIRKYKFNRNLHDYEIRNVLGLLDMATEAGCQIVAFVRDRDGDREREDAIEDGIRRAADLGFTLGVVGGVAIETVDAWILALRGVRRSQEVTDPKAVLRDTHHFTERT